VASRALAFSDPEVIRLASTAFVSIADNCSNLQRQQDPEGDFFRLVAEQGHYGGRTHPSDTRQGQYACTPDGRLLASINTREGPRMIAMLRLALEQWEAWRAGAAHEVPAEPTPASIAEGKTARVGGTTLRVDPRFLRRPPEGGMVLRVFARDVLPREHDERPVDWRTHAVNHDHAWFRAEELPAFLPQPAVPGATATLPEALARRLVRFHLIDNVRGETPMWRAEDVQQAEVRTTIAGADGDRLRVRLEGRFRCASAGSWAIRPFGEHQPRTERGFEGRILGQMTWDRTAARPIAFEAIACGNRWGGSEHNCRYEDLDPAPMGVLFELADGTAPGDAIPPQGVGWGDYWG